MLATLLKPTSGTATVNGYDIVSQPAKVRASIGIVFQAPSSDDMLTGYENLHLHSMLYSVPRQARRRRIEEVLELVGLSERKHDQVKTYSGGMRRRLEIARGLLHKPKVMFLDEPTLGLDPRGQQELLAMIQRIARERDTGVVLSSHLLSEIEGICDDVVIMNQGQIVAKGSVDEVLGQAGASGPVDRMVRVRVAADRVDSAAAAIDGMTGARVADRDPRGWLSVEVEAADGSNGDAARNRVLETLIDAGIPVLGFEVAGGRLQDVFLQLTAEAIA